MTQDVDPARVLARMRELDRRKLAAGRKAKDAKQAGRREMWRKAKQRQRLEKVQIRTRAANQCEPVDALAAAEKDKVFQQLFGTDTAVSLPKAEHPIRTELLALTRDKRAPASARVTAMRTLAEMDGHIGRLQTQPGDTSDQPLAMLTREQLENELARLRAIVASRDA